MLFERMPEERFRYRRLSPQEQLGPEAAVARGDIPPLPVYKALDAVDSVSS